MFSAPKSIIDKKELLLIAITVDSTHEEKIALAMEYVTENCHEKLASYEAQAERIVSSAQKSKE